MKIYLSKSFRTVLNSGFHAMDSGFFCQWNLDSGFLELFPGFQNLGSRIPQVKIPQIPESGSLTCGETMANK